MSINIMPALRDCPLSTSTMGPGSGPGRGSSLSIDGAEAMGLGQISSSKSSLGGLLNLYNTNTHP